MTELILAVNSTQAVQGVNAISREVQDFAKKADEAASRVDVLETQVGDLSKQLDSSRRATGSLADENRRLKDTLVGTQAQMDAAAQKTRQFQQAAGALTELQSISARAKILGDEIGNLGTSFGSSARVGQAFAGVLLDVAQVGDKAKGGLSAFTALLRSNPLLAAAGVISAIATAMALFGKETKQANVDLERQIKLQEELRRSGVDLALQIQRTSDLQRVGFNVDAKQLEVDRAKQLTQAASSLAGQPGTQSISDLQTLTGLSYQQLRDLAQQRQGLVDIQQPSIAPTFGPIAGVPAGVSLDVNAPTTEAITNEAARVILLQLATALRIQAERTDFQAQVPKVTPAAAAPGISGEVYGPALPPPAGRRFTQEEVDRIMASRVRPDEAFQTVRPRVAYEEPIGPSPGPGFEMPMTPEQLAAYQKQFAPPTVLLDPEKMKQDAEELERFNEKLREMKSLGQDVGAALGSAFFSIVNGAANARQALAALLQQFVAIAQQRAIQGIANSIGNAFGSTVQQTNANAQTPGTANTGISLRGGSTP